MSQLEPRPAVDAILETLRQETEKVDVVRLRDTSLVKQVSDKVAEILQTERDRPSVRLVVDSLRNHTPHVSNRVRFTDVGTVQRIGDGVAKLSGLPNARTEELVNAGFEVVGYNPENLALHGETAAKLNTPLKIHLKIETGTNRQGVSGDALIELNKIINKYPNLELAGVYTHFANIEDTTDHSYAMEQLERYQEAVERLESIAGEIPFKHASCSAAGLLFPEAHFRATSQSGH